MSMVAFVAGVACGVIFTLLVMALTDAAAAAARRTVDTMARRRHAARLMRERFSGRG